MNAAWANPATEAIARLVSARTGFTYAIQHPTKTEEGIRRAMAARAVACPRTYFEILGREPEAMDQLMDELTIRETYFFREPRHFDFIRREILERQSSGADGRRPVRAWSAGCASGEEAYSLAILMNQAGVGEESTVLGTDISQAALTTARGARFRDWSLRGASSGFLASYFRAAGAAWELIEPVRERVRFAFLNLALDAYPSHVSGTQGMDLILCRNVLIYFDAATIDQVAKRLCASLRPGGWLVTASSDPSLGGEAGLEPHVTEHGVFYRRPVETVSAPRPVLIQPAAPVAPPPRIHVPQPRPTPVRARETAEERCEQAALALRQGDYARVLRLIPDLEQGVASCRLRVDALANESGPDAAAAAAAQAVRRHPLSAALHFRHAVLLSCLSQLDASEAALRRVIYLDRGLAFAHFALGALHWRGGRLEQARRCYHTVVRLCAARPPDEVLALAEGQTAAALAADARRHLAALGDKEAISA